MAASGFARMVTGQSDGKEHVIHARFDDRVVLTSVDLSDNPWDGGGKPAALEIVDGGFFVVTMNGREVLIEGTDPTEPDTDHDGTNDGDEVAAGTDPLTP